MTTRALQIDVLMSPIHDYRDNSIASGYTVYFYSAGTSTAKNVWTEKEKTNPYTSRTIGSDGTVQVYGDGVYKIVIKDADATTVYEWDNVKIQSPNVAVLTKADTYTATPDDDYILVNTAGGDVTINIEAAANFTHPICIKNIGANSVVINPDGSELIEGAATYTISTIDAAVWLFTNGSAWYAANDTSLSAIDAINLVASVGGSAKMTAKSTTIDIETNNEYLRGINAAGDGYIDIVKVNASDQIEFGTTISGATITNEGLHLLDTNASHDLIIKPGSDLSADRILTITTGDAARTVTLNGNTTLNDWFDQSVKQAASPTFAGLTLTADLTVENGGTGASTLTDHGVLVGSGTDAITPLAAMTNGQLVIGNTGNDPSVATLTQGSGITVTNAAGAITVAHTSHTGDVTGATALTIGAAKVTQSILKTSSGEVSSSLASSSSDNWTLPGGEYGFYPQVKVNNALAIADFQIAKAVASTSYITNLYGINNGGSTYTLYGQQRYVTSSGEIHWIFILIDKTTGEKKSFYSAPDHPCFGNRGILHPFPDYNPLKHEIIVINPSLEIVKSIELARAEEDYLKPEKSFLETFQEIYEINESKEAVWPDLPVTVALPRVYNGELVDDWRFMPRGIKIEPVKRVITKPDYIIPLTIRLKK